MSLDLFKTLIPSLLENKNYTLDDEKSYIPFVVNKALSHHIDCIFYVNQMNMYHGLDNKLQYDYYFNSIRKYKRRYQKWFKNKEHGSLRSVMEYYKCSSTKAKTILSVLTDEQLEYIETRLYKD